MTYLYEQVLRPILFLFNPEYIHDAFVSLGEIIGSFWITRAKTKFFFNTRRKDIAKVIDGITYRTPVLLAAGFDYNGRLTRVLPCISFGGEEVGSVTARRCDGNPKPRMTRLPKSKSIIVNKGLRNDGVDAVISRLKKNPNISDATKRDFVIGVSIARTNDTSSVDLAAGIDDYVYSFKRLNEEGIGDYYAINISCPNAFGGEAFTKPDLLAALLTKLVLVTCKKPIYIKMPINLPWDKFDELLKIIDFYKIHGVIIGNLNKDYESIGQHGEAPDEYSGGLSGMPCRKLSTELIRLTRQKYGRRFTIIGVGGIFSAADAREKFEAGADLVQLITGMIYEGPGLIKDICDSLPVK